MKKAKKDKPKKDVPNITVKTDTSLDELFQKAINTPIKNSKVKKK